MFHKVRINDKIHAYKPNQRWTVCGEDKIHQPRVYDDTMVDCVHCVDIARSDAIRSADHSLGFGWYPELRAVK